jgi:hypothetical protein
MPAADRDNQDEDKSESRQVIRGKSYDAIMRKHYGQLSFSLGDRSKYCFQIIDLLRGVPIIAALQSVGEFSRAFSKTLCERLFCEINCDS